MEKTQTFTKQFSGIILQCILFSWILCYITLVLYKDIEHSYIELDKTNVMWYKGTAIFWYERYFFVYKRRIHRYRTEQWDRTCRYDVGFRYFAFRHLTVGTVPDSNQSEPDRRALADIDTNIPQARVANPVGKMRKLGIVVTGLSKSQTVSFVLLNVGLIQCKHFTYHNPNF